jgi:hypothetical protein
MASKKITDTTYTTTDLPDAKEMSVSGLPAGAKHVWISDSVHQNIVIDDAGDKSYSYSFKTEGAPSDATEKTITIQTGKMRPDDPAILHESTIDTAGHTLIIKKVRCGATAGEIANAPEVTRIIVLSRLRVSDLKKEERDRLAPVINGVAKDDLSVEDLKFYPNPSDGKFNLAFRLPRSGKTQVTIFDITGKKVYDETLDNFSGAYDRRMDLSQQKPGTYIVRINQDGACRSSKLVIE